MWYRRQLLPQTLALGLSLGIGGEHPPPSSRGDRGLALHEVVGASECQPALNSIVDNFIKIHRTLRTSPAMAAGVTDRLWDVNDLVALWESYERTEERAA
jgi:hypothetical protein